VVLFHVFSGPLGVGLAVDHRGVWIPVKVRDELGRTDVSLWIAMAIEAESHAERFRVGNHFHLVDLAMAAHARDTTVDVN